MHLSIHLPLQKLPHLLLILLLRPPPRLQLDLIKLRIVLRQLVPNRHRFLNAQGRGNRWIGGQLLLLLGLGHERRAAGVRGRDGAVGLIYLLFELLLTIHDRALLIGMLKSSLR